MKLCEKQQIFTACVGKLIQFAGENGVGLTFGDAYRDPRVHGHFEKKGSYSAAKSVHKIRLAVDFNMFVGGKWIQDGGDTMWLMLGTFWEELNENARWGGRFIPNDSNHFSFEHWGCK